MELQEYKAQLTGFSIPQEPIEISGNVIQLTKCDFTGDIFPNPKSPTIFGVKAIITTFLKIGNETIFILESTVEGLIDFSNTKNEKDFFEDTAKILHNSHKVILDHTKVVTSFSKYPFTSPLSQSIKETEKHIQQFYQDSI